LREIPKEAIKDKPLVGWKTEENIDAGAIPRPLGFSVMTPTPESKKDFHHAHTRTLYLTLP